MENQYILKINQLLDSKTLESTEKISLTEMIKLLIEVDKSIKEIYNKFLKKINYRLGGSFAFFTYKATNFNINSDTYEIILECNVIKEKVVIDKNKMVVTSKFKEAEALIKLLQPDFDWLNTSLNKFQYLNKLSIKATSDFFNINITNKALELFIYKSPNWTIMGKSFSLRYLYLSSEFIYEIDHLDLKKFLYDKEQALLSKIFIDLNILPEELKTMYILAKQEELSHQNKSNSSNLVVKIINKIANIMKK